MPLSVEKAEKIIKISKEKPYIYRKKWVNLAALLISRANNKEYVFSLLNELVFCQRWPEIKAKMKTDAWDSKKIMKWEQIYKEKKKALQAKNIDLNYEKKIPINERIDIGWQIRQMRKEMGEKQQETAEKIGCNQQFLSRIENGDENLSIDSLKKIAKAFNKKIIIEFRE